MRYIPVSNQACCYLLADTGCDRFQLQFLWWLRTNETITRMTLPLGYVSDQCDGQIVGVCLVVSFQHIVGEHWPNPVENKLHTQFQPSTLANWITLSHSKVTTLVHSDPVCSHGVPNIKHYQHKRTVLVLHLNYYWLSWHCLYKQVMYNVDDKNGAID